MKILNLKFKNFRSYGNNITEIDFSNISSLNQIRGNNGAGKSSIINCILWMLYGKCDLTKAEMMNRVNKNTWGYIKLEDASKHIIEIERGISPDKFEVTIDNVRIDTAGKLNVQNMLEVTHYNAPYFIFRNIVACTLEGTSIIEMSSKDRKTLFESIMGLSIIGDINTVCSNNFKDIKDEYNASLKSLEQINSTITNSLNIISQDNNDDGFNKEENDLKITHLNKLKSENNKELRQLFSDLEELNALKSEYDADKQTASTKMYGVAVEVKNLKSQIAELEAESEICPVCGNKIDQTKKQAKIDAYNSEITKKLADIKEFKNYIGQLEDNAILLNPQFESLNGDITILQSRNQEIDNEIRELYAKETEYNNKKSLSTKVMNEWYASRDNIQKDIDTRITPMMEVYDLVLETLGKDGVIREMSQKYIDAINTIINEICNNEFFITFSRKDYSVKILCLGKEVSVAALSTGEKRKIDFAVKLGLLSISRTLMIPNINTLFIDEAFASIDFKTVNEILVLLKRYSDLNNINIFLIHHSPLDASKFDSIYQIEKESTGFSMITKI